MQNTVLGCDSITLKPNYNIPIIIIISGIALTLWSSILALVIIIFGIFLLIQANLIRLTFTSTALDVYRGKKNIRTFPYTEWETWAIFWQPLPILLYFKEVKSIHFLPIIFDPNTLRECLEQYCSEKK
ncbi:glycerol dehydrogenase and related enzymes [Geminocystis sp. NIES-3708]|uniref:DUF3119 family protein n=1 Tax=Geminocystis sp. NIES-3708 TaxID=1615909 RepID=UPI0005FCB357|nr:DUF3119 family protein [Geminocystis sp. NIES-3708]BAQ62370.1 glycerol dehydrogenase and related enzymes [Geminocystis sp. NIES-3708]